MPRGDNSRSIVKREKQSRSLSRRSGERRAPDRCFTSLQRLLWSQDSVESRLLKEVNKDTNPLETKTGDTAVIFGCGAQVAFQPNEAPFTLCWPLSCELGAIVSSPAPVLAYPSGHHLHADVLRFGSVERYLGARISGIWDTFFFVPASAEGRFGPDLPCCPPLSRGSMEV